ncbi:MAG: 8-oxo-dGTP diphosphatase [Verrucomicrobiaceae bacterium]|nr:MAG: 8-oxo-dGTP diphosphatase [Verrucomicrobiaceae bacterium]
MDWTNWTPLERATLCFIVKDGRILLIHKRRGLGAGKVNGPGGKLEPGETPLQAAVRETQEEIGVTPLHLEERGIIRFHFTDGYSLLCTVFLARDLVGNPIETAEATPFWAPVPEVPYDAMWEDDQYWLPQVLDGSAPYLHAWFEFEGERMLSKEIRVMDAPGELVDFRTPKGL